jgi:beta-xylosidase
MYNGGYGFRNLTVQSTGHVDVVETLDGSWYASFLARRKVDGSSPLGRETFLTTLTWEDNWPVLNDGRPILLNNGADSLTSFADHQNSFVDDFNGPLLDLEWYQIRTPYSKVFEFKNETLRQTQKGLFLKPNVFSLSDRDHPAALFRKQKSLNMTFTVSVGPVVEGLQYRQSIGISAYLSEMQHQDLGVRKCATGSGLCVYTTLLRNGTSTVSRNSKPSDEHA